MNHALRHEQAVSTIQIRPKWMTVRELELRKQHLIVFSATNHILFSPSTLHALVNVLRNVAKLPYSCQKRTMVAYDINLALKMTVSSN